MPGRAVRAWVLAWQNEADRSFAFLERAAENKSLGLRQIVLEHAFHRIRSDPRWMPLLEKLGKAPAQLDAIQFDVPLP